MPRWGRSENGIMPVWGKSRKAEDRADAPGRAAPCRRVSGNCGRNAMPASARRACRSGPRLFRTMAFRAITGSDRRRTPCCSRRGVTRPSDPAHEPTWPHSPHAGQPAPSVRRGDPLIGRSERSKGAATRLAGSRRRRPGAVQIDFQRPASLERPGCAGNPDSNRWAIRNRDRDRRPGNAYLDCPAAVVDPERDALPFQW